MTERRPTIRRRPSGSVIWTPSLISHLRHRLRRGYSAKSTAEYLGVGVASIQQATTLYGLGLPPDPCIFVADLAHELSISSDTVYRTCGHLGIQPAPWGAVQRFLTPKQARQVREACSNTIHPDEARQRDFLTARQCADRLQITLRMFLTRAQRYELRRYRLLRTPGRTCRYDPAELSRLPVPLAARGKPQGFISLEALADLTGAQPVTLRKWVRDGLPHTRDRVGFHAAYVRPEVALSWLEAQRNPKRRRYAEPLAQALKAS
ncbi:hypothetical protein [Deinococcus sp.]|uniref:hypothetical protein n=1 Tax=Deinococcus sp. TaxID=47478 RepID=UPI0025E163A4|nr:hypothetical protein [Deinococcus sp.]